MKVKIFGIQLKFAAALIFSLILSFILLSIFTRIYSSYNENIQNYNYSFSSLREAGENLSVDLSKSNFRNINELEPLFQSYEKRYHLFKINFIITDGRDRVIYKFRQTHIDVNELRKFMVDTFKGKNVGGNVTHYFKFSYTVPLKINDRIYMLWITGVPFNALNDTSFNWMSKRGLVLMLCLSVFIFYMITMSKMKYIKEICRGLNKIAGGDIEFRIMKKGHDELAGIVSNVNYMADKIQEKITREKNIQRSKSELVTNVAHDIRSPLTSVIGFLEIVKNSEYKSEEEMKKFIDIALKKAGSMKRLTDNLFMFTKLDSLNMKSSFSRVCINELIYQVVDEFSVIFQENNLELEDNIISENLMVNIDVNMFLRALNNLFYNALEYSVKPSKVNVALGKEDDKAVISISNSCKDLNEENIKMIFERFYRADKSRSSPDNNSGLGLSIAKSIIEHHGGKITSLYKDDRICFKISMSAEKNKIRLG
ncbi:HAMP domain-containing sensor histidine kinase [Clostridium sp. JNZ X4-2]